MEELNCPSCETLLLESDINELKCHTCGTTFEAVFEDETTDNKIEHLSTDETAIEITLPTAMPVTDKICKSSGLDLIAFAIDFKQKYSTGEWTVKEKGTRTTAYRNKKKALILMNSNKKIRVMFVNVAKIDESLVTKQVIKSDTYHSVCTKDITEYNKVLESIEWK